MGEVRTKLLQSKLTKDGEIRSLKEIRKGLASAGVVKEQRRWISDGRVIEWEKVIKQRDSLATPARAWEILGDTGALPAQLPGDSEGGPVLAERLAEMNPQLNWQNLEDLLFMQGSTKSGFPESSFIATTLHQVWLARCDASRRDVKFQPKKVICLAVVKFVAHVRVYCLARQVAARKHGVAIGVDNWGYLAADEAEVMRHIYSKGAPLMTAEAVAEAGMRVVALDLLGLGASDKPQGGDYTIEAWGQMLQDFVSEVVRCRVVLVGNSIGSLVALTAAAALPSEEVAGVVLLNCAGGLNNKAIQDDWRIRLALPLFLLIDWLLSFPPLATAIFNRVRTRNNVASVLRAVYSNPDAVDDELVQLICAPEEDPGALHVFTAVLTGPPGPRPEHLLPRIEAPLLLLWGEQDPFTPLDGPVGRFFSHLPQQRPLTTMLTVPLCGHCPHDDQPVAVHQALLPWLAQLGSTK
ncbi:unnamed protein product [Closterium sp. NIES-65]|nr:unnamed protein product [Closterium sp. NIES-65]